MPEGDTVFRWAEMLRSALAGGSVTRFEARGVRRLRPGVRVTDARSRGKHLLITFDDGHVLHTHMGMNGAWRLGGRSGPRIEDRGRVRALIEVQHATARCLDAPVVEVLGSMDLRHHPVLKALGPDLCAPDPDIDEVLTRLSQHDPATPIGLVLLDQRVAAGIGNVYRSEVLFAEGVAPNDPLGAIDVSTRRGLFVSAHRMLRRNLGPGPRITFRGGVAVYGKTGHPCPRCGARIRSSREGDRARRTFWCPACQPTRVTSTTVS